MSKRKCGTCRLDPAAGLASVTQHGVETFYCHGDDDVEASCYERRDWLWRVGHPLPAWLEPDDADDSAIEAGKRGLREVHGRITES